MTDKPVTNSLTAFFASVITVVGYLEVEAQKITGQVTKEVEEYFKDIDFSDIKEREAPPKASGKKK